MKKMCKLVSKHPENVWCQFYQMEVDGHIYYIYERHIFTGYGMARNTPSRCCYLLIDQEMYEYEQSDVCYGPEVYTTDLFFDTQRIYDGIAQGIRRLIALRTGQT